MSRYKDESSSEKSLTVSELLAKMGKNNPVDSDIKEDLGTKSSKKEDTKNKISTPNNEKLDQTDNKNYTPKKASEHDKKNDDKSNNIKKIDSAKTDMKSIPAKKNDKQIEKTENKRGQITEEFYRITDEFIAENTITSNTDDSFEKADKDPEKTLNTTNILQKIKTQLNKNLKTEFAITFFEIFFSLIIGGSIFFTFSKMWQWNKFVTSITSFLITILMMVSVIIVQKKVSITSLILTLSTSMVLTVFPLILILQNS